jgi:hypothetical protein
MRGRPTKSYHFPAERPYILYGQPTLEIRTDKSNPSNVTRRSKLVILVDDFTLEDQLHRRHSGRESASTRLIANPPSRPRNQLFAGINRARRLIKSL